MRMTSRRSRLHTLLLIDAITCASFGALLALAAVTLGALTAIPPALLSWAGLALFPVAAFIAVIALQREPPAAGVQLIIAGNLAWVAASLWLLTGDWIAPNALGSMFIGVQAATVATLAALEWSALKRRASHRLVPPSDAGSSSPRMGQQAGGDSA